MWLHVVAAKSELMMFSGFHLYRIYRFQNCKNLDSRPLHMHDKFRVLFGYNIPSILNACVSLTIYIASYINMNAFFIGWTHGPAVRPDDWI